MLTDTSSIGQDATSTGGSTSAVTLDTSIALATSQLLALQHAEGHWVFELEADCTIPAEYVLMMHFMDEINGTLQQKLAHYLRNHQSADGSYPLYTGGAGDLSCTIKVYYALKLAGDVEQSSHMQAACAWILAQGGAAKANVLTRILLAMFEQLPWRGVPFIPVEIMLLPQWFPFHLDKIAYWARTVIVPMSILCSYKVKARNPKKIGIAELFLIAADNEKNYFSHVKTPLGKAILLLERMGRWLEPAIPMLIRRRATVKAQNWFITRLNAYDGLGGIFTAMVNAYEAMDYLGITADNEQRRIARAAIDQLLVIREDTAYCQPCVSPVWDTCLATLTLQEIERFEHDAQLHEALHSASRWLCSKQLNDEPGDWQVQRPHLAGGGWAFQFSNSYYPDVDDTAVAALVLYQANNSRFTANIARAANWIAGMQSNNGGYGAFNADNTHTYLNHVPFADHGALLDPPTADVSGRCLLILGKLVDLQPKYQSVIDNCIAFLRHAQETDGSWFGRWGTNYIYGTWSVLTGFESVGMPTHDSSIRKAVAWLKAKQREDGGWGEDNASYQQCTVPGESSKSTAFHTALALLALLSAGEVDSQAVITGVNYLLKNQQADGFWNDDSFNAPGFPKVFYLQYHGYDKFFPLWALGCYRNACFSTATANFA